MSYIYQYYKGPSLDFIAGVCEYAITQYTYVYVSNIYSMYAACLCM